MGKRKPESDTTPSWRARAHRTALEFNWDYGCKKLHEIIRQQCDLGTALLIYWRGGPNWYRQYRNRHEVPPPRHIFDMLVEIEQKVAAGSYRHANISFDPRDDQGTNRLRLYSGLKAKFHCELPEAMCQAVGTSESLQKDRPLSGKVGLPIGLAALASAEQPASKSERELAIERLNSLNDYSSREVVQVAGNHVRAIGLGSNHIATNDALEDLRFFPELEELALGQKMTDPALRHLSHVPHLKKLEMNCTLFTDKGLAQLEQLSELEVLYLHGCRHITDAGLAHVGKLTALKQLDLGSTKIGNEGLAHLQSLVKLEYLDLFWYTKVTNPGLQYLEKMKQLQWLRLSHTKVGDKGLVYLQSLTNLKRLTLGKTKVTAKGVVALQQKLPECEISMEVY